jgi:UDP:flavonoid glycosyltransferase YjiC (YdhE family)
VSAKSLKSEVTDMAHIVFITVGITAGRLNSNYRIAHQLRARGHCITFVSPVELAEKQVAAQGFEFVYLSKEGAALQQYEELKQERTKSGILWYLDRARNIELAKILRDHILESDEIHEVVRYIRPDLLLIESELAAHIIATSKCNIPTLLLEHHCSTRKAPNVPILSSNLMPNQTAWSSLLIEASWQAVFAKRKLRYALTRIYHQGNDWLSTLKELARRNAFSFEERVDLNQWGYVTFKDIPTLFLSAWEFDFPHAVENRERYVGSMVFLERKEPLADPEYQEVAQTLFAKRREVGQEARPLVYCAMGSIIADKDYFKRVIDVFVERQDYDLILSTGRTTASEHFGPTPPNVHLFNVVPQLDVLKRADLMLTHGGINTINECILLGVPMIVYSGGVMDENGNAARVEYHGLGLRGNLGRESSAQIAQKIDRVLGDPQYKANVQKMQRKYLAYHHSDKAIQIIEQMLGE